MENFFAELSFFAGSDVLSCPEWGMGRVQCYGSNVLAHITIGTVLGLFSLVIIRNVVWLGLGLSLLAVKEIGFDIVPVIGSVSVSTFFAVLIDSAVDGASYLAGAALAFWVVMTDTTEEPQ